MNPSRQEVRKCAKDFFFEHMLLLCGIAIALILLAYLISLVIGVVRQSFDPEPFGPADIFQSKTAISVSEARKRTGLPIPDSAKNIRLATFNQFVAYECFLRFESPVADGEAFAERVVAQNGGAKSEGQEANMKVADFPVAPPIAKSSELETGWFDVSSIRRVKQYGNGPAHAPRIWIDTEKGVVYYRMHD